MTMQIYDIMTFWSVLNLGLYTICTSTHKRETGQFFASDCINIFFVELQKRAAILDIQQSTRDLYQVRLWEHQSSSSHLLQDSHLPQVYVSINSSYTIVSKFVNYWLIRAGIAMRAIQTARWCITSARNITRISHKSDIFIWSVAWLLAVYHREQCVDAKYHLTIIRRIWLRPICITLQLQHRYINNTHIPSTAHAKPPDNHEYRMD